MSYGDETKKQLGNFNSEMGSVQVYAVFEKKVIFSRDNQRMEFVIPVAIEFYWNGAFFRIKAEDISAFMGLLNGYTKEFSRTRNSIMRSLERIGIRIEGM